MKGSRSPATGSPPSSRSRTTATYTTVPTSSPWFAESDPPTNDAPCLRCSGGEAVREGKVELPRPFGHWSLGLLALRTASLSACRPVASSVVLRPCVSPCHEQVVSKGEPFLFRRNNLWSRAFVARYI